MTGGLPLSWEGAWDVLAWRHARPHQRANLVVPVAAPIVANLRTPGQDNSKASEEIPLAVENGVTGRSNLKKDKIRGMSDVHRKKTVRTLPPHLDHVSVGMLVFIVVDLDSAEGELAIGLARAMQSCDGDAECRFMWFVRKEWCTKERKHSWSKSPTFRVAADPSDPSKPYVTKEHLRKVAPVEVVLTQKSKADYPRLDSECVRVLKEFCTQRGLWCPGPPVTTDHAVGEARPKHSLDHQSDSSDECQPPDKIPRQTEVVEESAGERVADRLLARRKRKL